jgi:L-Ala-D/L-Glu epimerase / N-acetyl-D-glutamate racemase
MSEALAVIECLEVFTVRFAFRQPFVHNLAARRESRSLIVRLRLSDGTVGYGEALPRPYLTGETEASVRQALTGPLADLALGWAIGDLPSTARLLCSAASRVARERLPAAFCGLELALLDASGRLSGRPVTDILGSVVRTELPYQTAVIGLLPAAALRLYLEKIKRLGKRVVKLKVGSPQDVDRVRTVRTVLGPEVEILLDANAAWTADEAIEKIRALEPFGLVAVEQPVAREDVEGMARVRREVGTPIMADESITSLRDARRLLEAGACDLWNLRIGKCGGLLGTLELAWLAAERGIGTQLGVLVGETGVLGAAGRLLAACRDELRYLEFDSSGLKQGDVLQEPIASVVANRAPVVTGRPGLGIEVDARRLEATAEARYATWLQVHPRLRRARAS